MYPELQVQVEHGNPEVVGHSNPLLGNPVFLDREAWKRGPTRHAIFRHSMIGCVLGRQRDSIRNGYSSEPYAQYFTLPPLVRADSARTLDCPRTVLGLCSDTGLS